MLCLSRSLVSLSLSRSLSLSLSPRMLSIQRFGLLAAGGTVLTRASECRFAHLCTHASLCLHTCIRARAAQPDVCRNTAYLSFADEPAHVQHTFTAPCHRNTRTYMHADARQHTCMHAYIHRYIHTRIHTYLDTYIHRYIHTYMYACIHSYIPSCFRT